MTTDEHQESEVVHDPCCGSGRMLLAYAEHKRPKELVGQDVDLRCVKMTAINLALRNMYGYVLWGNSLGNEVKLAYRTGMNMYGGFIRHTHPGEIAEKFAPPTPEAPDAPTTLVLPPSRPDGPVTQRTLFEP